MQKKNFLKNFQFSNCLKNIPTKIDLRFWLTHNMLLWLNYFGNFSPNNFFPCSLRRRFNIYNYRWLNRVWPSRTIHLSSAASLSSLKGVAFLAAVCLWSSITNRAYISTEVITLLWYTCSIQARSEQLCPGA